MKLHETLINKLLQTYEINSGWQEEWKLKAALQKLDVSVYTRADGTQILIPTDELNARSTPAWQQEAEKRDERVRKMMEEAKKANEGS